eukprot:GHRQ01027195.1.p1 GENE.GHRQ01027195.1~~GHRQ01027195.1.p1  ORF type:complete len:211 (+),score=51.12 GHRQ01027195.1:143-775(+)
MQLQRGLQQRSAHRCQQQHVAHRKLAICRAAAAVEGRTTKKQLAFPFVRIQGQEEMKLALLLNVIDPNIGGVLIMGDRGTAKSVAVRAVADLLPELDVVEGDPFNSSPTDPKMMGPDALARFRAGEKLPAVRARTPLVSGSGSRVMTLHSAAICQRNGARLRGHAGQLVRQSTCRKCQCEAFGLLVVLCCCCCCCTSTAHKSQLCQRGIN